MVKYGRAEHFDEGPRGKILFRDTVYVLDSFAKRFNTAGVPLDPSRFRHCFHQTLGRCAVLSYPFCFAPERSPAVRGRGYFLFAL